jgi:hypothetical protein
MPTDTTDVDKKGFSERLQAGMKAFGFGGRGGGLAFATRYGVKPPVVTAWKQGRHLPEHGKVRQMAKDWDCAFDWLYYGEGQAPTWFRTTSAEKPARFTRERREVNDVTAVQMAVESILETILNKVPGSASAFLADLHASSVERKFPLDAGLLLTLVGIAKSARAAEEAADRRRRRRDSGARKKL